ncbi:hypothetical protein NSB25_25785 [Acetatifactor muris]|uniref:Uncharacterized protein n=1 Tax=Acetatifactor muris TaxID=879566 RepID=A0A2K4ZNY4_9FIRM|nr:hypothetical protein [Acetatifactor muris]MCR2050648.1 hypothetical protein [Acetatifactor muris]SOY32198.1 hypothetical protein AMURIS_04956 [Acetatifactor muris]
MTKSLVFNLPSDSTSMINKFQLEKVLSNARTSIYQNDYMRFSVDNSVVRVLLYNENDINLLEQIREYFYGEDYAAQ